jgi:hypothetical protein
MIRSVEEVNVVRSRIELKLESQTFRMTRSLSWNRGPILKLGATRREDTAAVVLRLKPDGDAMQR